jgi:hypothetical protein
MKDIHEKYYVKIANNKVDEALKIKSIVDSISRIAAYSADMAEIALDIAMDS